MVKRGEMKKIRYVVVRSCWGSLYDLTEEEPRFFKSIKEAEDAAKILQNEASEKPGFIATEFFSFIAVAIEFLERG